jgi:hypothetical protein
VSQDPIDPIVLTFRAAWYFPLEMGEVIIGIAALGPFGVEVSAGRGGLD